MGNLGRSINPLNPSLQIDGVLMTMVDSRTINAREITGALREAVGLNINVFNTEIPRSVRALVSFERRAKLKLVIYLIRSNV